MNETEIKELANELEAYHTAPRHKIAAAELRRLSAINAELVETLEKAYLAGFNASSEGYNGEYPFQNCDTSPENDSDWLENRDIAIKKIKEKQ